jgi:hypothetical protein
MGRGLSPLQQQILGLAWQREQAHPGRRGTRWLLFPQEIFVRLYDWPITHPAMPWGDRDWRGFALFNSLHFQPSVIGEKRYRATMVTVSRALARLQRRQLLQHRQIKYTLGWCLTDAGRTVAQQLPVDIVARGSVRNAP